MDAYRVTKISLDDVEKIERGDKIPPISTTKAQRKKVQDTLELLNSSIDYLNNEHKDPILAQSVKDLAYVTLLSGDMYYADASKFELVIIVAKCAQLLGESFKEAFDDCLNKAFKGINLD